MGFRENDQPQKRLHAATGSIDIANHHKRFCGDERLASLSPAGFFHGDPMQIDSDSPGSWDVTGLNLEDCSRGELVSHTESSSSPQGNYTHATSQDNVVAQDDHEKGVDTCFGALSVTGLSLNLGGSSTGSKPRSVKNRAIEPCAIDLEFQPGFVKICKPESKAFLGLLPSVIGLGLISVTRSYRITASAIANDASTLTITVYGQRQSANDVGDQLSEYGLFLQQPEQEGMDLPYFNPQVLLPPGTDFEKFNTPSGAGETPNDMSGKTTKVKDAEKSRMMKLLDEDVLGPSQFREVQASSFLKTKLKPHQAKALSMMDEKERGEIENPQFPSVWLKVQSKSGQTRYKNTVTGIPQIPEPKLCLGGLLADDMGLGKTLSALALISRDIVFRQESERLTTLIVTPLSTLTGWEDEIKKHFKPGAVEVLTYHGSSRIKMSKQFDNYDIVLTTYETVAAETFPTKSTKVKKNSPLQEVPWHRVILDEAHKIRTRKTKVFRAVSALQARHRWCLTGTPIQNSLEDLGSLVAFLQIHPFEREATFRSKFVTPVQCEHSDAWNRIGSLVKAISLRRVKETAGQSLQLPPKEDTTTWVTLAPREKEVYDAIIRAYRLGLKSSSYRGAPDSIFQTVLRLRQISNHGCDLLPTAMQEWLTEGLKSADVSTPPLEILGIQECEYCSEGSARGRECSHCICNRCMVSTSRDGDATSSECPICSDHSIQSNTTQNLAACDRPSRCGMIYTPSSKVVAILKNLQAAGNNSDGNPIKSLVFSSWTKMLDLLEIAFEQRGWRSERIDGSKSLPQRRQALENFRKDPSCRILLASIGSAAVGLDLTVASQVHLVEPGWNPMLEFQALDRVHRLGQTKPVKTFRYITDHDKSIEQHIRLVQEKKLRMVSFSFQDSENGDGGLRGSLEEFSKTLLN